MVFMCIFRHGSSHSITPMMLDKGTLSYQQKRELIHANGSLSLSYLTKSDLLGGGGQRILFNHIAAQNNTY